MRGISYILLVILSLITCTKKEPKTKKSEFKEVYKLSEMAILMESMYEELASIKPKIIKGESIGEFPTEFEKIDSAKLTNGFERTPTFETFARALIEQEKELYKSELAKQKTNYNHVVKTCLACHQSTTGCPGPIPRINGLLIE